MNLEIEEEAQHTDKKIIKEKIRSFRLKVDKVKEKYQEQLQNFEDPETYTRI